ncbi:MAG: DEAD/DEAH box helicase [Candidatus Nanopelagicales bacterium]
MTVNTAVKQQTFRKLGLNPKLVNALDAQGIVTPFPIQAATIPDALAGHDILGKGQTGSGKTLAFGLTLLHNITGLRAKPGRPLAVVLAPTRELAQQINEVISKLGKSVGQESALIAGGLSYGKQVSAMKRSIGVVVATPGRLLDLVEKKHVRMDDVEIMVLDEADQMADMGFLPDVKRILNLVKPGGQRFLFSATLDRDVDVLVKQYLVNPKTHEVADMAGTKSRSAHYVFLVSHGDKTNITSQIAAREGKAIFFTRTKRGADRLSANLANVGVKVGTLHGGKSQAIRTRTLAEFKKQDSGVLVATDVAARGIHVDDVDLVLHFDAPADHKDYLHRSGRTARAGKAGRVVTLATKQEQKTVNGMTSRAGVEPKVISVLPMDQELVRITGAKKPSGVPILIAPTEEPKRAQPKNRSRSDRNRSRSKSRNRFENKKSFERGRSASGRKSRSAR